MPFDLAQPAAAGRAAIRADWRRPEAAAVAALLPAATLPPDLAAPVARLARDLTAALRAKRHHASGVDTLMQEFSLSTPEGVALLCLAEALLRIPDAANADRLIRDKLARGDWAAHTGSGHSLFVNAVGWGLLLTGRLVAAPDEGALAAALRRGGEPLLRTAMDAAMRVLGEQFVIGEHIGAALQRAAAGRRRGYRHSFDMLGESALAAADAQRYASAYARAIEAIGAARRRSDPWDADGISVKLSALHPRFCHAQRRRIMAELLPRLAALARLAAGHGIGFSIDAEEADRLELTLDLLEALAVDPALAGWDGLGIAVQAYQKRAAAVVDHLIGLARESGHRLALRLVKGAYWDAEIKRAQADGLADFPVFTRKAHTDVCYLACARRLLEHRDVVFPQFATHNALSLAAIHHLAGPDFRPGDYEYQCLYGMGEALYDEVVGPERLARPCRIYAPVGSHDTLLAYLVRRLLENGANSSFVNRLVDESVSVDALLADPAVATAAHGAAPNPRIALPRDLYGAERLNSAGIDLADDAARAVLETAIAAGRRRLYHAAPLLAGGAPGAGPRHDIVNPARRAERVGTVVAATPAEVDAALAAAAAAAADWAATPAARRAALLDGAAARIEAEGPDLVALLVREAGKTLAAAVAEVREAADYCRYYAARARRDLADEACRPLGPVACISPWNFPLAIFVGQAAGALAAGNPVLAKPALRTPLIATRAVRLLHAAGIPPAVLQLLPGSGGNVGARLVADARVMAVIFTGSTAVAGGIRRVLAGRGDPPLIGETGGQNCLIVDSTALPEQVVADVLASAFDSAGQRCSALRVLCLQEEVAEPIVGLLQGALAELAVGDPARFETDIGPVIDAEAAAALEATIAAAAAAGRLRYRLALPENCRAGSFVAPALIDIASLDELSGEVFGPVLHLLRFSRARLGELVEAINASGYGLTLGIHSRIDATIDFIVGRARAGNIYVNRTLIGAVVGVQPFGGEGLSGTGPKAGGPLYLHRLLAKTAGPRLDGLRDERRLAGLDRLIAWLEGGAGGALSVAEAAPLAQRAAAWRRRTLLPLRVALPGPVGEDNTLYFAGRGAVAGNAATPAAAIEQLAAALATGNRLLLPRFAEAEALLEALPEALRGSVRLSADWRDEKIAALLWSGATPHDDSVPAEILRDIAARPGPIVPVVRGARDYELARLVVERVLSVNSAAAGGNARLMALGE